MRASAYVIRIRHVTFQRCGLGGCTTLAPFVLMAGGRPQLYCCAQCASIGVRASVLNKLVGKQDTVVVTAIVDPENQKRLLAVTVKVDSYPGEQKGPSL